MVVPCGVRVIVTLHCSAHNALAAELDFGRQHIAERRAPLRHESLATEERLTARERERLR